MCGVITAVPGVHFSLRDTHSVSGRRRRQWQPAASRGLMLSVIVKAKVQSAAAPLAMTPALTEHAQRERVVLQDTTLIGGDNIT